MARPERLIIFRDTPEKYIRAMANITLTGMLMRVMSVGLQSRRKMKRMMIANIAP